MDLPNKGIPEIPLEVINQVLSEVGFPIVTYEDLKITEKDVLDLFVRPAMQRYFAHNPNQYKTTQNIQQNVKFELPFPTDDTFGVLAARVALIGTSNVPAKFNIFREYRHRSIYGSSRNNVYDNPYYTREVKLAEQAANFSYINLSRTGNMEIDRTGRMLRGFSTIPGELVITWARCSNKWADVRFEHESDVIDLAKAYALRYFGLIRSQMDANTGVSLNGDTLLTRADAIEEKIKEKWEGRTKVTIMR